MAASSPQGLLTARASSPHSVPANLVGTLGGGPPQPQPHYRTPSWMGPKRQSSPSSAAAAPTIPTSPTVMSPAGSFIDPLASSGREQVAVLELKKESLRQQQLLEMQANTIGQLSAEVQEVRNALLGSAGNAIGTGTQNPEAEVSILARLLAEERQQRQVELEKVRTDVEAKVLIALGNAAQVDERLAKTCESWDQRVLTLTDGFNAQQGAMDALGTRLQDVVRQVELSLEEQLEMMEASSTRVHEALRQEMEVRMCEVQGIRELMEQAVEGTKIAQAGVEKLAGRIDLGNSAAPALPRVPEGGTFEDYSMEKIADAINSLAENYEEERRDRLDAQERLAARSVELQARFDAMSAQQQAVLEGQEALKTDVSNLNSTDGGAAAAAAAATMAPEAVAAREAAMMTTLLSQLDDSQASLRAEFKDAMKGADTAPQNLTNSSSTATKEDSEEAVAARMSQLQASLEELINAERAGREAACRTLMRQLEEWQAAYQVRIEEAMRTSQSARESAEAMSIRSEQLAAKVADEASHAAIRAELETAMQGNRSLQEEIAGVSARLQHVAEQRQVDATKAKLEEALQGSQAAREVADAVSLRCEQLAKEVVNDASQAAAAMQSNQSLREEMTGLSAQVQQLIEQREVEAGKADALAQASKVREADLRGDIDTALVLSKAARDSTDTISDNLNQLAQKVDEVERLNADQVKEVMLCSLSCQSMQGQVDDVSSRLERASERLAEDGPRVEASYQARVEDAVRIGEAARESAEATSLRCEELAKQVADDSPHVAIRTDLEAALQGNRSLQEEVAGLSARCQQLIEEKEATVAQAPQESVQQLQQVQEELTARSDQLQSALEAERRYRQLALQEMDSKSHEIHSTLAELIKTSEDKVEAANAETQQTLSQFEASIRDELDRATLLSRSSHHSAESLTRKVEQLSEQVAEVASKAGVQTDIDEALQMSRSAQDSLGNMSTLIEQLTASVQADNAKVEKLASDNKEQEAALRTDINSAMELGQASSQSMVALSDSFQKLVQKVDDVAKANAEQVSDVMQTCQEVQASADSVSSRLESIAQGMTEETSKLEVRLKEAAQLGQAAHESAEAVSVRCGELAEKVADDTSHAAVRADLEAALDGNRSLREEVTGLSTQLQQLIDAKEADAAKAVVRADIDDALQHSQAARESTAALSESMQQLADKVSEVTQACQGVQARTETISSRLDGMAERAAEDTARVEALARCSERTEATQKELQLGQASGQSAAEQIRSALQELKDEVAGSTAGNSTSLSELQMEIQQVEARLREAVDEGKSTQEALAAALPQQLDELLASVRVEIDEATQISRHSQESVGKLTGELQQLTDKAAARGDVEELAQLCHIRQREAGHMSARLQQIADRLTEDEATLAGLAASTAHAEDLRRTIASDGDRREAIEVGLRAEMEQVALRCQDALDRESQAREAKHKELQLGHESAQSATEQLLNVVEELKGAVASTAAAHSSRASELQGEIQQVALRCQDALERESKAHEAKNKELQLGHESAYSATEQIRSALEELRGTVASIVASHSSRSSELQGEIQQVEVRLREAVGKEREYQEALARQLDDLMASIRPEIGEAVETSRLARDSVSSLAGEMQQLASKVAAEDQAAVRSEVEELAQLCKAGQAEAGYHSLRLQQIADRLTEDETVLSTLSEDAQRLEVAWRAMDSNRGPSEAMQAALRAELEQVAVRFQNALAHESQVREAAGAALSEQLSELEASMADSISQRLRGAAQPPWATALLLEEQEMRQCEVAKVMSHVNGALADIEGAFARHVQATDVKSGAVKRFEEALRAEREDRSKMAAAIREELARVQQGVASKDDIDWLVQEVHQKVSSQGASPSAIEWKGSVNDQLADLRYHLEQLRSVSKAQKNAADEGEEGVVAKPSSGNDAARDRKAGTRLFDVRFGGLPFTGCMGKTGEDFVTAEVVAVPGPEYQRVDPDVLTVRAEPAPRVD